MITGAVVSTTLIVWTQELLLPAQSVAVQVRVMTRVLGQLPATLLSLCVIIGAGSQLSVAVALPVTIGSLGVLHWTVAGGGQEGTRGSRGGKRAPGKRSQGVPSPDVATRAQEIRETARHQSQRATPIQSLTQLFLHRSRFHISQPQASPCTRPGASGGYPDSGALRVGSTLPPRQRESQVLP